MEESQHSDDQALHEFIEDRKAALAKGETTRFQINQDLQARGIDAQEAGNIVAQIGREVSGESLPNRQLRPRTFPPEPILPVEPDVARSYPVDLSRYHTLLSISRVAIFLIACVMFMDGVVFWSYRKERSHLNEIRQEVTGTPDAESTARDELEASDDRIGIVGVIWLALYVGAAITFFAWVKRCYNNIRAFGGHDLSFNQHQVWRGFFLPLLNLVRPYQIVDEAWKVSTPNVNSGNADQWREVGLEPVILLWWFNYLINYVVALFLYFSFLSTPLSTSLNENAYWQVYYVSHLIGAGLTIAVVRMLSARQVLKYQALRRLHPTASIEVAS